MGSKITITISGEADSGQMELAGRIAQMLEYLDIEVTHSTPLNTRNADNWRNALAEKEPKVHIVQVTDTSSVQTKSHNTFLEHLKNSSKLVEDWPDWKKGTVDKDAEAAKRARINNDIAEQLMKQIRARHRKPGSI